MDGSRLKEMTREIVRSVQQSMKQAEAASAREAELVRSAFSECDRLAGNPYDPNEIGHFSVCRTGTW